MQVDQWQCPIKTPPAWGIGEGGMDIGSSSSGHLGCKLGNLSLMHMAFIHGTVFSLWAVPWAGGGSKWAGEAEDSATSRAPMEGRRQGRREGCLLSQGRERDDPLEQMHAPTELQACVQPKKVRALGEEGLAHDGSVA
eukprot:1145861-Pelagomonas_calceolata.AAC.10